MLRTLMLVSGVFEALFGFPVMIAPNLFFRALGTESSASGVFVVRVLGAATLGLAVAALLARSDLDSRGGLAAAYGLGLYNVLAGCLILWTAAAGGIGGAAALWGGGLIHAAIGALFVYALATLAK
jgi:hypothetical protein